jgi:hypothetical protein
LTHEVRDRRGQHRRKNIMKLISAQELQNMNETERVNFFNALSSNQARKDAADSQSSQTVSKVARKLDLYSDYSFD